jgi:hypothetical protein
MRGSCWGWAVIQLGLPEARNSQSEQLGAISGGAAENGWEEEEQEEQATGSKEAKAQPTKATI